MKHERGAIDLMVAGYGLVAAFVLALVLALPIYTVAAYHNDRTVTCTVDGKESIAQEDGHEYRVYTSDCGNFKVADAFWARNFHASDTYADIKVGETYKFDVNGFRIPFFSDFPNILAVHPA